MTETNESASGTTPQGGPADEPARMGPFARFFNVFVSPAAVFEDVRRNSGGWWATIVIGAIVSGIFASLYFTKYDMALVLKAQLTDSSAMKIVSSLMGPEARDKAIEEAVKKINSTPAWQMHLSVWGQNLAGWSFIVWFFTFLYGVMALAMGWTGEARASKLFISLGIVAAIGVGFILFSGAVQISQAIGAPKGADGRPIIPPTPAWVAIATLIVGLIAGALILWTMSRLAREVTFGRIMAVVSLGMAPSVVSALVGIIIAAIKSPDATPMEELVPSTLTALLNLKDGVLASVGSSLGLFTLWSLVLTSLGLSKALGRKTGEAAALVLIPWGIWVLCKAGAAALFG